MEGPFRLLLVVGVLAALLPAAATFGPQPCEPTQVALLCATDHIPSAHCCETLVAAVDLGVPCLCRVAAEPKLVAVGLNATQVLALYTSCGGLRPHLAAAAAATCQGPAPPPPAAVVFPSPGPRRTRKQQPAAHHEAPPSTSEKPPQQRDGAAHSKVSWAAPQQPHSGLSSSSSLQVLYSNVRDTLPGARYDNKCAARQLAGRLVQTCDSSENAPSAICCQIVSTIVEQSCLCEVSEEAQVRGSTHMGRSQILFLYNICGGEKQVPPGQCGPLYPPPPPPPPASLLTPPSSPASHSRVSLSVLLPSLAGGLVGLLGIGYAIYSFFKWAKLHGFFGGEAVEPRPAAAAAAAAEARPRAPDEEARARQRDAAAAAAEARARAADGDGTGPRVVHQPVGAAQVARLAG